MSRDPVEEQGGASLYVFCGNLPQSRVDLLGDKYYYFDKIIDKGFGNPRGLDQAILDRWQNGKGRELPVDNNTIPGIHRYNFQDYPEAKMLIGLACKCKGLPVTILVDLTKHWESISLLGELSFRIQGSLISSENGWTFEGTMTAVDEKWDFEPLKIKDWRTPDAMVAEFAGWIYTVLTPAQEFSVKFNHPVPKTDHGDCP